MMRSLAPGTLTEPRITAGRKWLRLDGVDQVAGTIDVEFDGNRVWSVRLERWDDGSLRVRWANALRPYLHGSTRLTLTDSADGTLLAESEVTFPGGAGRVEVTDSRGRWLAVNKWNRLGPSFSGDSSGVQRRLLEAADVLARELAEWGYNTYIVGGTLLGAIRNGSLLPHDDDIDFAFLCEADNPIDVALDNFALTRRLEAAGYSIVRHSLAHVQVTYFTDDGETDYYIDIFTGFFEGGEYNQPFALRGELQREDLLPLGEMQIEDVMLPAPANPDAWLVLAYGPSWRVPDPSFKFVSPRSTIRRFQSWFGVYNRGRVYWEKRYGEQSERVPSTQGEADVDRFLVGLPEGCTIVDLGCGDGRLTDRLAASGHPVLGVDYSHEALRLARAGGSGAEFRYLNFNDRHAVLDFAMEVIESGIEHRFIATELLHTLPPVGRENLLLMLRQLLERDATAMATFPVTLSRLKYAHGNPDSWHLTVESLQEQADLAGIDVHVVSRGRLQTTGGVRSSVGVTLTRRDTTAEETGSTV